MDAELCELLTQLGRAGYMVHSYWLDQDERPEVVAAVLNRGDCADVVILHRITTAYVFRTPTGAGQVSSTRPRCSGTSRQGPYGH